MKKIIYKVAILGTVVLGCLVARQQAFNGVPPPPPALDIFRITVPATQAYTGRTDSLDNSWEGSSDHGTQPGDLDFEMRRAAPDFSIAGPEEDFNSPNALVLLKNNNVTMRITASSTTGAAVRFKVYRDRSDSSTVVGTGTFTLTAAPGGNTATMKADRRGSFYLLAYIDTSNNGDYNLGEPSAVIPIIIVQADVVWEDSSVSTAGFEYIPSPAAPAAWANSTMRCGKDLKEGGPPAIFFSARCRLTGGGGQAKRGTDRVYAGWSQQIQNSRWTEADFADQITTKTEAIVFTSSDTGGLPLLYGQIPIFTTAAPALIDPPFLDSSNNPSGDGANSICLGYSSYYRRETTGSGQLVDIEAEDSVTMKYPKAHSAAAHAGLTLKSIRVNPRFRAYLALWTSQTTHQINETTDEVGAGQTQPNLPGERTYFDAWRYEWSPTAVVGINSPNGSQINGTYTSAITDSREYSPISPADGPSKEHETRPPIPLDVWALDAN